MKFHKNEFLTTVTAVALVLAVGACGSSSDDDDMMSTTTPTTPTTPTDTTTQAPETPEDALATAQAGYDALTGESTDAERTAAMTALVAALMLEGNEDAYVTYLEKKVADQEAAAAATAAAAAAEEASDMAKAVIKAIKANTILAAAPMVTLAASSAGELTATLEGYMMSAAPEEIAGWRGRTLAKDGDTTVIYTNIEDEVPTSLGELYDIASVKAQADLAYTVVDGEPDDSTIHWSYATRADDDDATTKTGTGVDQVTSFAGSVLGVDGTFSCDGDTCMAPTMFADDGTIVSTGSGGMWSFAPTDPGAMLQVKDTAYLSFGWWLNAMGSTGAYEFDAFASATGMGDPIPDRAANTVDGSATYRGAAAGKYAMQSTTDDSASGGHFTAAATLTANFDAHIGAADADDPNNENGVSIGGAITDFMTGDVSRPNWKVTLKPLAPVPNFVGPITGAMTEWATGGAVDGKGTWSANFYGEEDDTMHPMAATGEFNAVIGGDDNIARISGAFGATKQ